MSEKDLLTAFSSPVQQPVTRRQLLRTMATGSLVLSGAAALASCGGSSSSSTAVSVTLTSADWPFTALPDSAAQAKDPTVKAYAATLNNWLGKNPGVKIKKGNADSIWDSKTLTTAVTAGTVATWYPSGVLGNWAQQNIRGAFAQGFAADLTPLIKSYNIEQKLAEYAKEPFHINAINGKYYCFPDDYDPGGHVVTYRRDLIQQQGLQEPTDDWTWDDLRTLAKGLTAGTRKGTAMQSYGANWPLQDSLFKVMNVLPDPKSGWRWHTDYTSRLDDWKRAATIIRTMRNQDGSILTDTTYGDGEVAKSFGNEHAAMTFNVVGLFTIGPNDPTSPASLAKRLGKHIDEVVGVARHPHGPNGAFATTRPSVFIASIDPHLSRNPAALEKAFSLLDYMTFGQGFIDQKVAAYQAYKDLQMVYTNPMPVNGIIKYPGVPGTPTDAWGQRYIDTIHGLANSPLIPEKGFYFPAEKNTGPSDTVWSDIQSAIMFSHNDIGTLFTHGQQVLNQQEASFTSSIADDDFTRSARAYYHALDAFWSKNAPAFYANDFHPWLQKYVAPAIGL